MLKRLLLLSLVISCGKEQHQDSKLKEAMNQRNNPESIPGSTSTLDYTLNNLPDKAAVERVWSGYWWPMSEGGTSSTRYGSPSPLAKYDKATGAKANDWEITEARKYSTIGWAGHCNGVAAASIMTEEPSHSVTYKNVVFTTTDIKALLTEAWQGSGYIVGDRCDKKSITYDEYGRIREEECRDTNPATFHIAVTNFLGLFGKALIADVDPSEAVWNYPITSYEVTAKQWISRNDAVWRVQKRSDTFYVYNTEAVEFVYVKLLVNYKTLGSRTYEYILELDQKGKILGGEWIEESKKNHPDFIWRADKDVADNPNLDVQLVNTIYKQSL
jgi:hypothetical protein